MKNSQPHRGKSVLFVDIETVGQYPDYKSLSPTWKKLWDKKSKSSQAWGDEAPESTYANKAGIFSEFGRIIVIGFGYFVTMKDKETGFLVSTLYGHEEKALLSRFVEIIEKKFDPDRLYLCGHNGKEFDFPYLCRRMIVNQVPIPKVLSLSGKKPWEVRHLDTMEMWKFGDWKKFTSLDLLASLFEIPTSKDDIDGSDVHRVYHHENNLERIATYCKKDVVVTAQVYQRLTGLPLIKYENVIEEVGEPMMAQVALNIE